MFNAIRQYGIRVKEDFFFSCCCVSTLQCDLIYEQSYPSQSKFPIVCVCQIVLQQLEKLAGVNTAVP